MAGVDGHTSAAWVGEPPSVQVWGLTLFDASHPFYRPLWRRVAIVAITGGWAVIEYRNDAPIWAALFMAISLWCAWFFFVVYKDVSSGADERDKQTQLEDEGD